MMKHSGNSHFYSSAQQHFMTGRSIYVWAATKPALSTVLHL